MTATVTTLRVRPRRSLMTTAFVSIVLTMIPVFGVLYWFAIQHGSWMLVFVVHLAVTIACLATHGRQLTVFTAVTETELVGNGIFSPVVRIPLTAIASVVVVPTYIGQSLEPVPQLLVRDASLRHRDGRARPHRGGADPGGQSGLGRRRRRHGRGAQPGRGGRRFHLRLDRRRRLPGMDGRQGAARREGAGAMNISSNED